MMEGKSNVYITAYRIKRLREAKHMTKEELGKRIGKDRIAIYRYEKAKVAKISYSTLSKLAKELGTSVKYLSGETDIAHPTTEDIIERSEKPVLDDLFQDNSGYPIWALLSLSDEGKELVKLIIKEGSCDNLNDEDYKLLHEMLDVIIRANTTGSVSMMAEMLELGY